MKAGTDSLLLAAWSDLGNARKILDVGSGTGILARSGRAKYCPACAKEVHRQQKAKSARKRRSDVDNSGAKSP